MSQAPSMPVFIDAYLADTSHLTTEEHGAYVLLLFAMWRRGGAVPDDDKDNARVTRLSLAKWRKVKARLLTFVTLENGDITQKRLKKEWNYVAAIREKNAKNGASGGRPRSNKNNDIGKANGSVSDNPDESPHSHSQTQLEEKKEQEARSSSDDVIASKPLSDVVENGVSRETIKQPDLLNLPRFLDRREKASAVIVPLVPAQEREAEIAVEAFNLTADYAKWPRCQRLTDTRKRALKTRLVECGGLDGWKAAMARAAASSFLIGKTGRGGDHAKWRPDIDFFLSQSKFTKLMEGGYDDPDHQQGQPTGHLGRIAEAAAFALAAGNDGR